MKVGDKLLDASKMIGHVADLPVEALGHVHGIGPIVRGLSPFQKWDRMATAIQHGDFRALAREAKQTLSEAEGVISLVPGIGTGISAGISAGLAVLQGGGPLDIAIRTAYGAIPIPPGIRDVTDTVLDAVLALLHHGKHLTEVVITVARDRIPEGFPRHVFDTLVHVLHKHHPVQRIAGELLTHYVHQYAPHGVGLDVPRALAAATTHIPVLTSPPHVVAAPHFHLAPPHGHAAAPLAPHVHAAPHVAAPHAATPFHMAPPMLPAHAV